MNTYTESKLSVYEKERLVRKLERKRELNQIKKDENKYKTFKPKSKSKKEKVWVRSIIVNPVGTKR